jgi:hypothetical protein
MRSLMVALILAAASSLAACQVGDSIAESHIDANVPSAKDFDVFMKRDLEEYFKGETKKTVDVTYELLRQGATQAGTAFPKFYVWVVVKSDGAIIEEGAVRVAAMEKKRFGVYNYLSKSEIEQDVEKLYRVFPRPVADKIKERLGK